MEYPNRIQSIELNSASRWSELRNLLDYMTAVGCTDVNILFGFAWGNAIYSGEWQYINLPISEVEHRIRSEELRLNDKFELNDLFIRQSILDIEIQFCHESDIHIFFSKKSSFIDKVADDWRKKGLTLENGFRKI